MSTSSSFTTPSLSGAVSETSAPASVASPSSSATVFRLTPSSRSLLSRRQARELLAPLTTTSYTQLIFSGCTLGDAFATVAGPILVLLAQQQTLESVVLSDILATLPPDEALRSLSALASSIGLCKQLVRLDLSHNALGSRGIAACAPLIQGQTRLRELTLQNAGLAAESIRLLKRYLVVAEGRTTEIRKIKLDGNRIEGRGLMHVADIVKVSPYLEVLAVPSVGADAQGMGKLVEALRGKVGVRELDCSDNRIDVYVARELGIVISGMRELRVLKLNDLDLGDDGLDAVLKPVCVAGGKLTEIRITGNEITEKGAGVIAEVIDCMRESLEILDVARNELGGEGVEILAETLAKGGGVLKSLLVGENGVSGLSAVKVAMGLRGYDNVECVDFGGNEVADEVGKSLKGALGEDVVVNVGDVKVNGEDDEEEKDVEEVVKSARALKKSIRLLSREMAEVADGLDVRNVGRELRGRAEGALLVEQDKDMDEGFVGECVRGGLVAVMVVVLVLGIVQRLEEESMVWTMV